MLSSFLLSLSLLITWNHNSEPDLNKYQIYIGYESYSYSFTFETPDSFLIINNIKDYFTFNQHIGFFSFVPFVVVTALDSSDNESAPSSEVSCTFYDNYNLGDIDGDLDIDFIDLFSLYYNHLSYNYGDSLYSPAADCNSDSTISLIDLFMLYDMIKER